jgi:hypothetical protein
MAQTTVLSLKRASLLAVLLVFSGCQTHAPPPSTGPAVVSGAFPTFAGAAGMPTSSPTPDADYAAPSSASHCAPPPRRPTTTSGTACGPLDCRSFAQAEDAIAYLMRETAPVVLAVGEIHAQKGLALKASPTQRFSALLPLFCGNSRHIVIELMTGRNDCGDNRVEQVQKAEKPVTQAQATTNQNDFFELGNVAKLNHIQPHALTPTCDEFRSILAAKDQDIARRLELTATRTADLAEELLARSAAAKGTPYVILYGGAMHNDMLPLEGREGFSYGPRLDVSSQHRTTELDIVLREQVKDTESFQRLPWFPHFRADGLDKQFILYRLGPKSFTLIYPDQSQLP